MKLRVFVSEVRFTASHGDDADYGLLGWIACVVDGSLALDGLALRRTMDGRLTLSFPARRDRSGRRHHYVRPSSDAARREIEEQVFAALGLCQGARR